MPHHHRFCATSVLAFVFAVILVTAAPAQSPQESTAFFSAWSIEHSSHSPCAGAEFMHAATEDPVFVEVGGTEMGYCLDMAWTVACTGDGLVFFCELSGVPEWYQWGRYVGVQCDLTCRVDVTRPLLVTATRSADSGIVAMTGRHDVLLTDPDGAEFSIFGADSTATSATRLLEPGTWGVAVDVFVTLSDRNYMTYSGLVQVAWSTPVAVDERSWGAIKSLYR